MPLTVAKTAGFDTTPSMPWLFGLACVTRRQRHSRHGIFGRHAACGGAACLHGKCKGEAGNRQRMNKGKENASGRQQ